MIPAAGRSELAARLAELADLRHRPLRRSPGQPVVVEGPVAIARLVDAGLPLRLVVVSARGKRRLADVLDRAEAPVVELADDELADLAGYDVHRGALATIEEPPAQPWDALVVQALTLVVAEAVSDQENLGALVRNAWALGADGLLLGPACPDPFARRVVRVSVGLSLLLPIARVPSPLEAVRALRAERWRVLGLETGPGAVPLGSVHIPPDEPLALVLGAEGPGLTRELAAELAPCAEVPMARPGCSLNVATALAVALALLRRTAAPDPRTLSPPQRRSRTRPGR